LVHVPDTANIREGDLLVSSGLGGRFPRGYPVAEVSRISKESGEPFITIEATPTANLNQSRMLLVVFQALVPDNQRSENQLEPEKDGTGADNRVQEER
jgi:rod shape-determining protein MreC